MDSEYKLSFGTIFGTVVLFIVILLGLWAYQPVKAGSVEVVTQFGKVSGRVLHPGLNWIVPLVDHTIKYNTKLVTYETASEEKQKSSDSDYKDFPVNTTTSDGQPLTVTYTVRFSVMPDKAGWVAQNIGKESDVVEKVIKTESRTHVRNIARKYPSEQLYTGQVEDYQQEVFDTLKSSFEKHGIYLDFVGIREPGFSQEYIDTIEQKQIEQEKVLTAENVAKRAVEEKKAQITKAEGEAEAQRLQRESLSDTVLAKLKLENERALINQWNGAYPQTMMTCGGDNPDLLLSLPQ